MSLPCYSFIHPLIGTQNTVAAYLMEHSASACAPPQHPALIDTGVTLRHPWFVPIEHFPTENAPQNFIALQRAPAEPSGPPPQALLTRPDTRLPPTGEWAYLIIPMSHARTLPPFALTGLAVRSRVITSDTQNHKDREWAMQSGCSMSTCEYLLTVNPSRRAPDTTRQKMLTLLSLIAQDADTQALEEVLRQEAKLSYSLLRLVNSAAIAPRTPITSFSQAINLLGRRQLERWVQLLIFASPEHGGEANPLLYTAALRGRMMETLVPHLKLLPQSEGLADSAFMIGCFSLLSILLHIPMPEIVQQLPLNACIKDALNHHGGSAGQLLLALEAAAHRNLDESTRLLQQLEISPEDFLAAQLDALHWAERISTPL
ncbi:EAL and HDOD domain-containing protein [Azonexus sp.]|uniref:EAL and HDOD domain-containing protein n=1 Tax=Azonexus sp. TaxID=1872668 RepID=UPI0039E2B422